MKLDANRQSGLMRKCQWCNKEFPRYGVNKGWAYCSEKCNQSMKTFRYHQKKAAMESNGIIHGRPVQVHNYIRYKKSSESKGRPFELTQDEFNLFWQKPCTYCGSEIKTIGLDRLDSTLGYTRENVTPCCTDCNMMKRGMSLPAFINHCKKVARKSDADFVAKHNLV